MAETTGQQLCSRSQPPAGQPGHALSWAITRNQDGVRHVQRALLSLCLYLFAYIPLAKASQWPSPESERVGTNK